MWFWFCVTSPNNGCESKETKKRSEARCYKVCDCDVSSVQIEPFVRKAEDKMVLATFWTACIAVNYIYRYFFPGVKEYR